MDLYHTVTHQQASNLSRVLNLPHPIVSVSHDGVVVAFHSDQNEIATSVARVFEEVLEEEHQFEKLVNLDNSFYAQDKDDAIALAKAFGWLGMAVMNIQRANNSDLLEVLRARQEADGSWHHELKAFRLREVA